MAEIIVDLNKIETEDELLVRLYPAKGEKGEQGEKGANGADGAKGDKGETGDSGGSAVVVNAVADMSDTTQAYLYVGNESGYTKGDWYYYDGTAWVSGGKYGADGGVNTNARNILRYILQRVAYTEQGMQTYVDALYQALAQAGGGGSETTTYMIMNVLTNVANSNTATGIDEGESYTATLTADEGYSLGTVTVTMGGDDITSTAYSNGEINIASVTGDVIITASAVEVKYSYSYANGDLIKVNGAPSWTEQNGLFIGQNSRNRSQRRGFVLGYGEVPYKITTDDTTFTDSEYYPIPIPADATSATVSVTPNTQFHGEGFHVLNNGTYARTWDPGWKQGSFTYTFTAGQYEYLSVNCKYNSSGGTYSTEPTELTVIFNK